MAKQQLTFRRLTYILNLNVSTCTLAHGGLIMGCCRRSGRSCGSWFEGEIMHSSSSLLCDHKMIVQMYIEHKKH
ncbi:hypothetical protein BLOT_013501 [Blomia tropicalis]|nr:hypothetical protein BLOT_013501 [Blomia tropicalis]